MMPRATGTVEIHQASAVSPLPSLSIRPHSGCGGWLPIRNAERRVRGIAVPRPIVPVNNERRDDIRQDLGRETMTDRCCRAPRAASLELLAADSTQLAPDEPSVVRHRRQSYRDHELFQTGVSQARSRSPVRDYAGNASRTSTTPSRTHRPARRNNRTSAARRPDPDRESRPR